MLVKVTLRRSFVRAALIAAAKEDVRWYLKGLAVELHRDCAFIIGCDGARLHVFRDGAAGAGEQVGPGIEFIIPRDALEKLKSARGTDIVDIAYDTEAKTVAVDDFGTVTTVKAHEGLYPDWRRVLPKEVSGEASNINVSFLADLPKLAKALDVKDTAIQVSHGGNQATLVTIDSIPEFAGVIMPMRSNAPLRHKVNVGVARPPAKKPEAVPA
jgi:DNA polymerase-3 subunit beta